MPGGRPTDYSEELTNSICAQLAQGHSLAKVCASEDMPSISSVYNWFKSHPEFLEDYTRAKDDSADADQDKLDSIAEKVLTGEHDPQSARVAADIIKWSMGKKKPKKYGDKMQADVNATVGITFALDYGLKNGDEDE